MILKVGSMLSILMSLPIVLLTREMMMLLRRATWFPQMPSQCLNRMMKVRYRDYIGGLYLKNIKAHALRLPNRNSSRFALTLPSPVRWGGSNTPFLPPHKVCVHYAIYIILVYRYRISKY